MPPPPMPPVAHDSDCQAVMVPSFFAASLILANAEGRLPAIFNSVARSRYIFTGLPPLALESRPASTPQLSATNLLPKPPPMYCISTCTLAAGTSSDLPRSPPMPDTFCVEGHRLMRSPLNCTMLPCDSRQQCVI